MGNKYAKLIALIDTAVEHINDCYDEADALGDEVLANRIGKADLILISIQDELKDEQ